MRRSRLTLGALVCAAVAAGPRAADAAEVLAFGDSWAFDAAPELQLSLTAAGYPFVVANYGQPGQTAEYFATAGLVDLPNALAANPDARWVWLSAGGNDLITRYPQQTVMSVQADNIANLTTVLDQAFLVAPNVRVVMFDYDFTNYVDTPACVQQLPVDFAPGFDQGQVNQANDVAVGGAMRAVAALYPNVTYVSLRGSLQQAGGVPVDPADPSPMPLMRDCYHPTSAGYRALMDAMRGAYWQTPVPTAQVSASPTRVCPADPVDALATTTQAVAETWTVDSAPAGSGPTLTTSFSMPGLHEIALEAHGLAWTATAGATITVDPCVDAGFPDAAVDAGVIDGGADLDAGVVDVGVPDTGVEPDAGFPDTGIEPDAGFPDTGVIPDAGFPDTGIEPDAGFPDTGVLPDAGFPDTGIEPDAGFPDTGVLPDAGFPDTGIEPDAGFSDTGIEPDAGFPDAGAPDTGVEPDAGAPDAGFEPDAGLPDTGIPDAGIEPDAGPPDTGVAADAGGLPVQGPLFDDIGVAGGCRCVDEETAPPPAALGLLGVAWVARRRRRRR